MQRGRKQLILVALALLLVAALTTFVQSSDGQRFLRRMGIVAPSHGLTELAFVHPAALPNVLAPTRQHLALPFTIANRHNRPQSYRWQLVAGPVWLKAGIAHVPANGTTTVTPRFAVRCHHRTHLQVELSTGQSIGVWLDCSRQAAALPTSTKTPIRIASTSHGPA